MQHSVPAGVLPNFLGIGVQRAATTWLHDQLAEHPDVFVPDQKELDFFDRHFEVGLDWYRRQFGGHRGESAVGEITPLYFHTVPPDRIASVLPDARLIVILREPVARCYSAYRLLHAQFAGLSFSQACQTPRGQFLLKCSYYSEPLRQFFAHYPRDQVHIVLYDDVVDAPLAVLRSVFGFLQVDPDFVPSNPQAIKNRIIAPRAQQAISRLGLHWAVRLVKRTPIADFIKRRSVARSSSGLPGEQLRYQQELKAVFRGDIDALEQLIGRDLSRWR